MRISVIVPTYRRSEDLRRCLASLRSQTRAADEVIVTVRTTDAETADFLKHLPDELAAVKAVFLEEPGVVAAMNAGLEAATGDVIALTDDDAAPWPDWLQRIEAYFETDAKLGGVGGRDWQYKGGRLDDGREHRPGELQWWGRVTSMHHHAAPGPPREVAVIKGVNSAYRAAPLKRIGFDTRLLGSGAQVHWELSLDLALRRQGWKIVFDPAIGVDHFPAVRFDEDQRGRINAVAIDNAVYNETLVLYEHLSAPRRVVFVVWCFVLGTRGAPGLAQFLRLCIMAEHGALQRYIATMRGRVSGIKAARRGGRALCRSERRAPCMVEECV